MTSSLLSDSYCSSREWFILKKALVSEEFEFLVIFFLRR